MIDLGRFLVDWLRGSRKDFLLMDDDEKFERFVTDAEKAMNKLMLVSFATGLCVGLVILFVVLLVQA